MHLRLAGARSSEKIMVLNSDIYDGWGDLVGSRCFTCYEVFPSMWGETCNRCRASEERHEELLAAIKAQAICKK